MSATESLAERQQDIYRLLAEDGAPSPDELNAISGVPKEKVETETRRWRTVLENLRRAETSEEREAARQRLADAEALLVGETPQLESEIEERQRRLAELKLNVKRAAAIVDAHSRAVEKLRQSVPPHIAEHHRNAVALLKSQPQTRRLRQLRTRVKQIASVCEIDLTTLDGRERAKHFAARNAPDLLDTQTHGVIGGKSTTQEVNLQNWNDFINRLQSERQSLDAELSALEDAYRDALARLDEMLNFYIR